MAGRGSAPGERRGGRRKGTPNRATAAREAEIAASGMTPLDYMLSVLRDEDASIKERMWAAVAAAPYCHAKPRPKAHDADAGRIQVNVVRFTHEQSLAELEEIDARARRLEAERLETDTHRAVREPPQPPQTSPQPPAPALPADPVPGTRHADPPGGNGADRPPPGNGAGQAQRGNGAGQPQLVNGTGQTPLVNGADVRRGPPTPRGIRPRPREIRDYPATHPVHGIV